MLLGLFLGQNRQDSGVRAELFGFISHHQHKRHVHWAKSLIKKTLYCQQALLSSVVCFFSSLQQPPTDVQMIEWLSNSFADFSEIRASDG